MLNLNVKNETSRLRAVVLGTAKKVGPAPCEHEAYDPKSREHILAGTYPKEEEMILEMEAFRQVLEKYDVEVYRPECIEDVNQIFARDISFVIDDYFIKSNILPERDKEIPAIDYIIKQVDPSKVITPPDDVHVEGGDVMLLDDYILVGTYLRPDYSEIKTARTNLKAVHFLRELFPQKKVIEMDLIKSMEEPRDNALHLDCCFQPVGKGKGIIYKDAFMVERDYEFLVDMFGMENLFHVTREEMYHMNCNVFSISPEVVVSEKNFTRLNTWMREQGLTVEEIPYAEISKQGGLLRCSTLPLIRD